MCNSRPLRALWRASRRARELAAWPRVHMSARLCARLCGDICARAAVREQLARAFPRSLGALSSPDQLDRGKRPHVSVPASGCAHEFSCAPFRGEPRSRKAALHPGGLPVSAALRASRGGMGTFPSACSAAAAAGTYRGIRALCSSGANTGPVPSFWRQHCLAGCVYARRMGEIVLTYRRGPGKVGRRWARAERASVREIDRSAPPARGQPAGRFA